MIPLYKPYIGRKEIEAVLRVLKSGKLSRGKEVEKFEEEFANFTKQKHAIAVNSGTSGLHLAVKAMGWKKGDEVITTPFSYIASSNALLFEGVKPIFVDIDPDTLNIDVSKIEEKITKNTKGILLVHIFGLPVETEILSKLKKKYNLQVIEDACEAIGRPSDSFRINSLGDISVYGFHENKQLTTGGEGGMITANNPLLAQKLRSLRDQGRSTKKNWLKEVTLGFNFRMTELQAAFGRAQLSSLDMMLDKRAQIAKIYSNALDGVKGVKVPSDFGKNKRSWFVYFLLFDKPSDRKLVYEALSRLDIFSSTNYFPPIYKFPMYENCKVNDCKNTEDISERVLVLPTYYQMTIRQVKYVAEEIKKVLNK